MIDEFYTWKIFGYYIYNLSEWSKNKVVVMCDNCCEYRVVIYDSYRDLCRSCAQLGHSTSEEWRSKISDANRGKTRPPCTQETRDKISKIHKGKPKSEAQKKKISETLKGKPSYVRTEETKQRSSATQRGIQYEDWDGFTSNNEYCEKFDEACRERIRAKYDHRCFVCDLPQDENITKNGLQKKLGVHHIDKNKNQGCDGVKWGLVPLCMHCHGSAHSQPLQSRIEYLLEDESTA